MEMLTSERSESVVDLLADLIEVHIVRVAHGEGGELGVGEEVVGQLGVVDGIPEHPRVGGELTLAAPAVLVSLATTGREGVVLGVQCALTVR